MPALPVRAKAAPFASGARSCFLILCEASATAVDRYFCFFASKRIGLEPEIDRLDDVAVALDRDGARFLPDLDVFQVIEFLPFAVHVIQDDTLEFDRGVPYGQVDLANAPF